MKEKSFSLNTSDFSSSQEIDDNNINEDDGMMMPPNNFGDAAANKLSSGRKPLPIKYYVHTRKAKIKQLKMLSEDKTLSVADRKKYRAQKFALQRRLNIKVAKHEKRKQIAPAAPLIGGPAPKVQGGPPQMQMQPPTP